MQHDNLFTEWKYTVRPFLINEHFNRLAFIPFHLINLNLITNTIILYILLCEKSIYSLKPLFRRKSYSDEQCYPALSGLAQWASYQMLHRKPLISNHGTHHGTCVTHVPWCMSGSLIRGGRENIPDIPGACATRNFTYLARGPWYDDHKEGQIIHILNWCLQKTIANHTHLAVHNTPQSRENLTIWVLSFMY